MYLLFEPWLEFFKRSMRAGAFPLWNTHQATGHPFFASSNSALLYPFSWLALLLDVPAAMLVIQFLNLAVGMLGMCLYARYLGLNWPGAILGGAVFGFLQLDESFCNLARGSVLCWAPLLFLSAHALVGRASFGRAAILAVLLTLSFLGGFPQYFLYACIVVTVYFLSLLALSREKSARARLLSLCLFGLAFVLTTGLCAVQLLPTIEVSLQSVRNMGVGLGASAWGSAPERIAASFYAATSGTYCLLIPFAFASPKHRRTALALTAALVYSLLFVLSKEVAVLSFFGKIPFLDSFRYPQRMLRFSLFLASALAAIGMSSLWSKGPLRLRNPDTGRLDWFWILTAGYVAVALYPVSKVVASLIKSSSAYVLVLLPVAAMGLALLLHHSRYPARVRTVGICLVAVAVVAGLGVHWHVVKPVLDLVTFFPLLLVIGIALYHAVKLSAPVKEGMAWGVVLLLAVGLHRSSDFYQTIPFTAPLNETDSKTQWVEAQAGYDRVLIHRRNKNVASARGFYSISDYETFTLTRWKNFIRMAIGPKRFDSKASYFDIFMGQIDAYSVDLLQARQTMGLSSMRYVILNDPLSASPEDAPQGLRLCYQSDNAGDMFYVYENTFAVPRAYLVNDYLMVDSENESLTQIKEHINDLAAAVVLENGSPSFPRPKESAPCGTARIEHYGVNEARIEVEAARPALLVLTDSHFPGWKARVDGEEKLIWRANSVFRAVEVGPGRHTVVFRYAPASFKIGVTVSLLTLLIILVGLLIQRMNGTRKSDAGPTMST
jgi:hypothetical protein